MTNNNIQKKEEREKTYTSQYKNNQWSVGIPLVPLKRLNNIDDDDDDGMYPLMPLYNDYRISNMGILTPRV
jgi:hypothetical protein